MAKNNGLSAANLGSTSNKTTPDTFPDICRRVTSGIIAFFVLVVLLVFPCYYRDYYFDILEAKYVFYYIVIIAMLGILLIASIIYMIIDRLEFKLEYTKAFFLKFSLKNLRQTMRSYDWFLLAFLITAIISTLQSDYVYESFWGNEGRFTGLFLHLLYIASFWVISRFYEPKAWHWNAFLLVAMWPLIFGITDFFRMDILLFKVEIPMPAADVYVSTFGNVNTYTTYVGIVFGVAVTLFILSKKWIGVFFYYICMVIATFALIMGVSDNAYLAILVVFGFLPVLAFRNGTGFRRYFCALATFFTVTVIISKIADTWGNRVLQLNGVYDVLADSNYSILIAVVLWMIAAATWFVTSHKGKQTPGNGTCAATPTVILLWNGLPLKIWYGVIVAVVLVLLFMLFDANRPGNSEKYGVLSGYLYFSDAWGTYRGYTWRVALEEFMKLPLIHKLFGNGLDTYGLLVYARKAESLSMNGQVYDSAHNEYLQYLVTAGAFGVVAYLGFLITAMKNMAKKAGGNPLTLSLFFACLCYLAQATVSINLPIVTPIFWMLLAMGTAASSMRNAASSLG